MGGSGLHNAMIAVRGTEGDFIRWSERDGNLTKTPPLHAPFNDESDFIKGWTWPTMSRIYTEIESAMSVSQPSYVDSLSDAFLAACSAAGEPAASRGFAENGGR